MASNRRSDPWLKSSITANFHSYISSTKNLSSVSFTYLISVSNITNIYFSFPFMTHHSISLEDSRLQPEVHIIPMPQIRFLAFSVLFLFIHCYSCFEVLLRLILLQLMHQLLEQWRA